MEEEGEMCGGEREEWLRGTGTRKGESRKGNK
jgi:hypothetical protein